MEALRPQRKAQLVTALGADGRLYRGHHGLLADLQVEQDLGPQPLHHLDHGVEAESGRVAAVCDLQIFRPDADGDVTARIGSQPRADLGGNVDAEAGIVGPQPAIGVAHPHRREIHRRRADEAGDKAVDRGVVEFKRLAHLLHQSILHHHDAIAQRHGLDLVVGDVDGRGVEPIVQLLQLDAHLHAKLCVQIGERLVEQEDLRLADDGAAERHALALPAGQLARLALEIILHAEDLGGHLHALGDLRAVDFAHLQAESHIVVDAHMRIERVVLEHHGDVAIHGRQLVHHHVADQDLTRGDRFEPRDHPQRGRLAAARRSDQH